MMALALGKSTQDEYRENLSKLTSQLKGQTGLLFTNEKEKKVLKLVEFFLPFNVLLSKRNVILN